jgi:pyrroline-5-carboxylate reductase
MNQGCNPFVLSPAINNHEEERLHKIFLLLGNSFKVKEDLLEAYAIVTAMSPTYFWYQWQYLAELGELFGLDEKACKMALYETISSSADLLFNSNLTYEEVKDLIPVKPLSNIEGFVKSTMKEKLSEVYEKIKPQNLVAN